MDTGNIIQSHLSFPYPQYTKTTPPFRDYAWHRNAKQYDDGPKTHNTTSTRSLMSRLFDPQFANVVDYDCFSQVVFEDIEDYVRMKEDAFYLERARGDHENFADTKRSRYVFLGVFLGLVIFLLCSEELSWREGLLCLGCGSVCVV